MRRQLHAPAGLEMLVGQSSSMQAVKTLIRKVAPSSQQCVDHRRVRNRQGSPRVHAARLGPSPESPFLAINCGDPARFVGESLFGHIPGVRSRSTVTSACSPLRERKPVFLDEIGELPLATQAKLLQAIETKEVLPIGANRPIPVKARIIAATNKDLGSEVAASQFRPDLYYRLNVVAIALPPLRDRVEDVPELVNVLLARHSRKMGKRVTGVDNAAMRRLMAASWKGTCAELDNALERAVILAESTILSAEDFT